MARRRIFPRILHENCLSGEKWKYIVTLIEAWAHLSDCNTIMYLLLKSKKKNVQTWFRQSKQCISMWFLIDAGLAYNGKLKIRRVEINIKINLKYYREKIYVRYLQMSFYFFILMVFIEWSFINTEQQQMMLPKMTLHSLKKMNTDTSIECLHF